MRLSISKHWRNKKVHYQLALGYCKACGKYHFPPKYRCPYCSSKDVELTIPKGEGTLIEWTVSYVRLEHLEHELPLIVGLVRLDEGPVVRGVLTDVDPKELREGMRLEAVLRRLEEDGVSGLIYYGIKFKPLSK
ncbi:MAG: DNA-binding protein [Thermoprotei archaeon]|nr:MAG: DNA-binding protein [Thermoprotei archaeon]